ncbi:hypothetical protein PMSD_22045 [Paenibacillus macquariensis subsp. defensor]|nr:hypothetical protein PMSD_22045 [Paenibacillus macquariensis subsp. defensor]
MIKWIRLIILAVGLFGLWAPVSLAHENTSLAYSDISFEDGVIKYVLQIDMYDLRIAATPDDPDIGLTTPEVLNQFASNSQAEVQTYLLSKIQLYADNLRLKGKLTQLHSIKKENEDQPFAEVVLEYQVRNIPKSFELDYHVVFESDQWHVNYVSLDLGELKRDVVMVNEIQEFQVGQMSLEYTVTQFFLLGLEHLLTGFEAILFVLALIIGCKSVKQTLMVMVTFMVANSLTLILAGLHIVTLPDRLVESIMALSILYTALSRLFNQNTKQRLWLIGGFGLFYGFGFVKVLSGMREDGGHYVPSLVAVNGGTEVGLVLVVLILYPAVHYARQIKWIIPVILTSIALFGLVWFLAKVYL